MSGEQRRLAAIVSADVAGYSRLMGRDESGTLAALKSLRREIVDPSIEAHRGRIVKTMGDGLLLEFASVVDAVRCVIEIQTTMAPHSSAVPADRRIEFRVGVNIGDVIIDGTDIFGDGVNVAARLQELAEPGGICVSGRVQEDVRGKIDVVLEDAGEHQLKNIAWPVRVHRIRLGSSPAPPPQTALALPDKPSIAVLPFQNMSGDAEQEYFADGVVEDIITALSRFHSLFVIARNSSFTYKGRAVDVKQVGRELGVRYVLEGSVRKAAGRLRVTAQLVDAGSGAHIWADRFDSAVEDVFELQDQVTEKVVTAIAPRVEQAEIARVKRKPAGNLDAYDCYLRGMACLQPISKQGLVEALRLFERAIELDPEYPAPYGMAMMCYANRRGFGLVDGQEEEKEDVVRLMPAALQVGRDDAQTLGGTAWAVAYTLRDLASAKALVDQAVALNPNLAGAWAISGWINLWLGHPETAFAHLGRALRHDPHDGGQSRGMRPAMAHACFFLGRYEEALSWAERLLQSAPQAHPALRIGAASAAFAGMSDLAERLGKRLLSIDPAFRVSRISDYLGPYQKPEFLAKYAEALRKAGLPE